MDCGKRTASPACKPTWGKDHAEFRIYGMRMGISNKWGQLRSFIYGHFQKTRVGYEAAERTATSKGPGVLNPMTMNKYQRPPPLSLLTVPRPPRLMIPSATATTTTTTTTTTARPPPE